MGMCVKMIKKNQIRTPETVSKPSMLPDKKPLWQEPASFDTEAVLLTTRAGLLHELADRSCGFQLLENAARVRLLLLYTCTFLPSQTLRKPAKTSPPSLAAEV